MSTSEAGEGPDSPRDVVRGINRAWVEGEPDRLTELLHERIVIVDARGRRLGEGRDACIASYRDFITAATVGHFREGEARVDVFGGTAVVDYDFEITYTLGGQTYHETGRDVFVLAREGDGRWLAVWRQAASGEA